MRRGLSFLVAVMFLAAPLASRAQATQSQQQGQATGAAQAPAAPATKPEAKPAGVTITPYGFILVNAYMNASNFTSYDYPGFATGPGAPGTSAGNLLMNARQTRFGARFTFPDAAGAKLAGVIEADFKGGFLVQGSSNGCTAVGGTPVACTTTAPVANAAGNIEWYRPAPRMRLAYGTATWSFGPNYKFQILAGQEYGLVNPLFATSLAFVADPIFYFAGNIWNRSAQLRLQGDMSGPIGVTWQAALLNPLEQGAVNVSGTPDNSVGNQSRQPNVEGRIAINAVQNKVKMFEVGVAGHYGKQRFTLPTATAGVSRTQDVNSLLAGVDVQLNLPFIAFKGEAFQGSNISEYFAHFTGAPNVGQYSTGAGATQKQNPIRAQGMWGQFVLSPVDMVQLTFGASVERDNKRDISQLAGGSVFMNRQLSGGLILSPSKNWKAGVEMAKTLTTRTSTAATAAGRAAAPGIERQGYVTAVSTQFLF